MYPEIMVIDFKPDGYALAIFKGLTSPIAMGIEVGYSALWDHNYIPNTVENTTQAVRVLYHNPEIVLEIAENAYEDFKDASGPERARQLSALTSNMAIGLAIPSAGLLPKLKLFTKPVTAIELNISGKVRRSGSKIGWKVGDPITNLTSKGNIPSWSAVRQRFWKNEALLNSGSYNSTNLLRMRRGLAPQRINPITGKLESMELHHIIPRRDGGLFEFIKVWPDEHRLIDPFRR